MRVTLEVASKGTFVTHKTIESDLFGAKPRPGVDQVMTNYDIVNTVLLMLQGSACPTAFSPNVDASC